MIESGLTSVHKSFMDSQSDVANMISNGRMLTKTNYDTYPFNSGDTAWILTSMAFVLLMSMPGLAIYYAGMVRTKNVLATIMQVFTICCFVTVAWLGFGYSAAYGPAEDYDSKYQYIIWGSSDRAWLFGMHMNTIPTGNDGYTSQLGSYHYLAPSIPEPVFVSYTMTYAILATALITGSFADRMRYVPMIIFILCWLFGVYIPIAHSIFHQDGFLNKYGVLDSSGGFVIFLSSGISGLVAALYLGRRKGYGKLRFDPHNITLSFIGLSLMWVGWYGLTAGSFHTSSFSAGYAMLVTQISSSFGALSWMFTEWAYRGTPSVTGMMSGCLAGLIAISSGAGYVDQTAAAVAGLVVGPICFFAVQLKHYIGYDDALDGFGVNAMAAIVGGFCTGFFANPSITNHTGVYYAGLHSGGRQLAAELYAMAVVIGWSAFATFVMVVGLDLIIGLRVSEAEEDAGLDASIHGESLEPKMEEPKMEEPKTEEPKQPELTTPSPEV